MAMHSVRRRTGRNRSGPIERTGTLAEVTAYISRQYGHVCTPSQLEALDSVGMCLLAVPKPDAVASAAFGPACYQLILRRT